MAFGRKDDNQGASSAPAGDGPTTISGRFSMPQAAAGRIQRLEQLEETDKSAFTSDLSVNEFVLLHKLGFDPSVTSWGPRSTTSACNTGTGASRWNSRS
jgi:hypothetical protein